VAGALPMSLLNWLAGGPLSLAGLLARGGDAAAAGADRLLPAAERLECVGGLEITTRAGAGRGDSPQCRLRWQGRPLRVGARGVDAVFVLGHGGVPDVLVHALDAGDTGAFHLLHQHGGRLHCTRLGLTSAGRDRVRVLGPLAVPAGPAPRHRPLAVARWLLLGESCVYDVVQRRARRVPPTLGLLEVWSSVAPLGLSPDGAEPLSRHGSASGTLLRVEGEVAQVLHDGFRIVPTRLGDPAQAGEVARQMACARRLGTALDAELASGRHDAVLQAGPVPA